MCYDRDTRHEVGVTHMFCICELCSVVSVTGATVACERAPRLLFFATLS